VLAEPTAVIVTASYPAQPATLAERRPRRRATTVASFARTRRSRPAYPSATPEQLPRRRDGPPSLLAASGWRDREGIRGTRPLRDSDPDRVDGYLVVSRLGAGGMADVFYAVAPTGRPVAMKVLHADPEAPEACEREYRLVRGMDPDCTAPALGHGVSTAGPYLVTTYLPGFRSGATLVDKPVSLHQLCSFGMALARVLAAVHARGVVHCDVKPSNLLVAGPEVRLIDFGIARYVGEGSVDGFVRCSRGFAAPEQLRSAPATPAVDIFAWGCLLAFLAGVDPFASQNEQEWTLRVQFGEPDLHALPPRLAEMIGWTLAREPQDRPSAHELATICQASL
jgi:serine/threonine protein kinase